MDKPAKAKDVLAKFPKNNKNTINKSAVVRKFWDEGLTSPVAIAAEAKKLGVNISPGYISLLTFIKRHKGPPKPRGKRRVAEPIVAKKAARGAKTTKTTKPAKSAKAVKKKKTARGK
jgi:hypothetical protein